MTVAARHPLETAIDAIRIEGEGVEALAAEMREGLGSAFLAAVEALRRTRGRVIVTGMGKSGLVGRKIAATFSSTGTPAVYIHPAEASHGDLGMITAQDLVLVLSWSGETVELSDIITYCRRFGVTLIAMTASADSALGRAADIALVLPRTREACPYQLAPTTSTTLQAVMGDAMAVALLEQKGFSASDFRVFHPGGKLGSQLLTVADLMGTGDALPIVTRASTLLQATIEMSRKRYGCTAVLDSAGRLVGAFTDGDLRRSISTGRLDQTVGETMSAQPLTTQPEMLASEALRVMNENAVSVLFVCEQHRLVGMIHLHDVLRAGVA